jgi:hypothetical protein
VRAKKLREDRRGRIRRIEVAEALSRCAWCKRSFAESGQKIETFLDPRAFCSEDCVKAATEGDGR